MGFFSGKVKVVQPVARLEIPVGVDVPTYGLDEKVIVGNLRGLSELRKYIDEACDELRKFKRPDGD